MESNLSRESAWRHVMSTAKSKEEIVERQFVGHVYDRPLSAPFSFVSVKEIVVSDGHIKKIARATSLRIVIVILPVCGGDAYETRSELRSEAYARQRLRDGGAHSAAREPSLKLLIGR